MNELTIKEDILSLSEMKQSEINVVLAQMTSLTNAIVSGRDDIDSMVTSLEKQPWYKRMWNTITGKNKATKEEIALKKDQMSQYTIQAISNLYEMGKINQDMIINIGQKVNDIYYQTTLNSFEQLMIKDSIIKLRTMVCTIAEKLNDKIEKIDNFTMLAKEIEQGVYNNDNPIIAICGVTSNLNSSLLNDSRKINIIKNDISRYSLFNDVEKTLTEFMNDVTNIPDDKAGMVYLELASMHDNIWASMFSELMESYNMLPKMERMAKKKDVIIHKILEQNDMDENAVFSSEDLFSTILDYKTEIASTTQNISYSGAVVIGQGNSVAFSDENDIDTEERNKYMNSLPAGCIMIDRSIVEKDYSDDDKNIAVMDVLSNSSEKIIAIPYGTKRIGIQAFCDMEITKVFIPDTVEEIGEKSFFRCKFLNDLVLPDSMKKIGNTAFSGCQNLESVKFNDGLTEIKYFAFAGTAIRWLTLPKGLTKIEDNVFYNCKKIESVKFNEGLTEIEYEAFEASSIRKIELPKGIKKIGRSAFKECHQLEEVILNNDLIEIESFVFQECENLMTIHFSSAAENSLQKIGSYAFKKCTSLWDIPVLDNIIEIEGGAFSETNITKIHLPATLRKIGTYAFSDCKSLRTVTFDEGLVEIGDYAFSGSGIREIKFPRSLKKVGNMIFLTWDEISLKVKVPENIYQQYIAESYGTFFGVECSVECYY